MTIYTNVFGGANIYPSEVSYSSITLTTDVVLSWPQETSTNQNLATKIIDVSADLGPFSIFLPSAQKAADGETILFNNVGSNPFIVKDADGVQVVTLAAGTAWQVYLTNNSTTAGSWISLQYGAAVSAANASALAGTGIIAIGTLLSQSMPVTQFNADYTSGSTDRAKMFVWNGSGAGSLTLPNPATVGNNWFIYLRNAGGGDVTVSISGVATIDGGATKVYQPEESSIITSDGTNYYSIGFGQSATFAFDYTVISVAGSGDYILSGSELNRIAYKFTGVLTGDRNIVVPDTIQQYWVDNSTTGAYLLTISSTTGGGVSVGQNERAILYCDGSDVVDADTSTVSFPLTIAQGGTGAVTAAGALINLGGTAVGTNIFTAADTAAVWSTLGIAPAGVVQGGTF